MSHGLWQFLVIWFVLIVILLVVVGVYYGVRAASRRRAVRRAAEPAVPRPSAPHLTESGEPGAAYTTDPSTIRQPGPLPKWFSRKLPSEEPAPVAPVAPPEPPVGEDFTIDPNAVKGENYGRQGEARDVRVEIQEVETSRGAKLRTLDGLRAQGFITDEEYEQRRAAILGA